MFKPTLAIIPGLVDSMTCLQLQDRIPNLRILSIDLLGYGKYQEADHSALTLRNQAEHVADAIAIAQHDRVWVMGHSLGGAVAFLLAREHPELVLGLISVEGNFTEQDAFWTKSIASESEASWESRFLAMIAAPADWLKQCGIKPTLERTRWATQILANQSASTMYAMSQATIRETLPPAYLETVRQVAKQGKSIHLVAGQKSASNWGLPADIRSAAASYIEIPNSGHLMMLESPDLFCQHLAHIFQQA